MLDGVKASTPAARSLLDPACAPGGLERRSAPRNGLSVSPRNGQQGPRAQPRSVRGRLGRPSKSVIRKRGKPVTLLVQAHVPCPACCTRGHARDLSGFLALRPIPLPGSKTPAGSAGPRLLRSCRCCPRDHQAEGSSRHIISGLTLGFGIHCLRFTSGVAATHARLASGWRAEHLYRGRESNPLERSERFQVIPVSFPGLLLTQGGVCEATEVDPIGWTGIGVT